jgi:hypothetical protein
MDRPRDGRALQENVEARRAQHRRLQRRASPKAAKKGDPITRTVQTGFDRDTGEAIYETEECSISSRCLISS